MGKGNAVGKGKGRDIEIVVDFGIVGFDKYSSLFDPETPPLQNRLLAVVFHSSDKMRFVRDYWHCILDISNFHPLIV